MPCHKPGAGSPSGKTTDLYPLSLQGYSTCLGEVPSSLTPQPDNAGQTPFPALTASHKGTWWEQAHATDSAAPSNMPKQLVNIKAAQTCATIGKAGTLQTGTLAPEGGTRVQEHHYRNGHGRSDGWTPLSTSTIASAALRHSSLSYSLE